MNKVDGEREEWGREINGLFWIERLFLFLVFVFPTYVYALIAPLILSTTLLALPFFFFFNPNLSSVGPSGIGGLWLFLLDRSTFYLCLEYSKLLSGGFEVTFLWRLTVFLSLVIHSIYIADHILISHHQAVLPPPQSQNVEIVEDGKKMIHSGLETLIKELGEFRDGGKKEMMLQVEHMICSTLKDNMRLNVDHEILAGLLGDLRSKLAEDIRALRKDRNKDLDETYLAIQETAKEAKTIADKAHETYLIFKEGQNKRGVIKGEDVEGFVELREQVRRMSVEAEIAAEEQFRATGELVDARIQQWEEDNADYLASLPLLYFDHHN